MPKKYKIPQEETQIVSESVGVYGNTVPMQHIHLNTIIEESNTAKKEYLRSHLHETTAEFLESVDWMENKPFPQYPDSDDDAWIDVAEVAGDADIVDNAVITKDRLAWQRI